MLLFQSVSRTHCALYGRLLAIGYLKTENLNFNMILMSRFKFSRTHCAFNGRLQAIGYLKTVQLPKPGRPKGSTKLAGAEQVIRRCAQCDKPHGVPQKEAKKKKKKVASHNRGEDDTGTVYVL